MIFKVKLDKSLVIMFSVMPIIMTMLLSIRGIYKGIDSIIVLLIFYIIVLALIGYIRTVKYTLTEDCLIISSLFYKKKITYDKIEKVEKRNGKWTLEAPSINQLRLVRSDEVLGIVSPLDQENFKRKLESNIMRVYIRDI